MHARLLLLAHDIHPNPGPCIHTPNIIYWLLYFVILSADLSSVVEGPAVSLSMGAPHRRKERRGIKHRKMRIHKWHISQAGKPYLFLLLLCHLYLHKHPQHTPTTRITGPYDDRPWTTTQIHTTLLPWDYHARLIRLSNDVHPNPGPPTPRTDTWCMMSLNVGGPHLSVKRWHSLLMEISQHRPHIVALQEVRFKTGQHHISWAAKVVPDYLPITHTHRNPDTMFLVHNTYAKYVTLYPAPHRFATCVKVALPGTPAFHCVNMHGPFTIATREDLDHWISDIPAVGILMGDFNDTVWATDKGRKRWWHDKLSCGTMHDPAMAYHPNAQANTLHTRKTKRLDAILVYADTWESLGVSGYEHIILSHAGDHKAVLLHIPDCMHTTTAPDKKSTGSVASLFRVSQTHAPMGKGAPRGGQSHATTGRYIRRDQTFCGLSSTPPPRKRLMR